MVMDYIDFIDSKDIRDFNRETLFSPAELAILVITSMHTSVDMKIKALNNLIDVYGTELDDVSRMSNGGCNALDDKTGFYCEIRKYVDNLEKAISEKGRTWFEKPLYIASLMEVDFNQRFSSPWDDEVYFETYDDAYLYLKQQKEEYLTDEDLKSVKTSARIKVVELSSPDRQYDSGLFMFDNEMELCYICLPCGVQQFSIDEAFYIHVPSPFKEGTVVKWNSVFYKPMYGVITHNPITREQDNALRYGDGTDIQEALDMYFPPEVICNIVPENVICTPEFWGWDHIPYLELETCKPEEIPVDLKPLLQWKKRNN